MSRTLRSRTRSADAVKEEDSTVVEPVRKLRKKQRHSAEDDDEDDESGLMDEMMSKGNVEGRPFEIIDCLPASLDVPDYNSALTHPLTVKDSAVLYNSLVQSRKTWVKGEMFELYWKRPQRDSHGAPVVDSTLQNGIRDRMQKMCEATMSAGPHQFDVRLFILKDDEVEKLWAEELEETRKLREEKKLEAQEEKKKRMEDKLLQQQQRKKEREEKAAALKEARAKAKKEQEILREKMKEEKKKKREEEKLIKKQQRSLKTKPKPMSAEEKREQERREGIRKFREEEAREREEARENHKMIMNLNHMSHEDKFLNDLMRKVARGRGSREEVNKFKEYIEIARSMAPCEEWIKHDKQQKENEKREKEEQEKKIVQGERKPTDAKSSIPLVPIKNKTPANVSENKQDKTIVSEESKADTLEPKEPASSDASKGTESASNPEPKSDTPRPESTTTSAGESKDAPETSEVSTPGPIESEVSTPGSTDNVTTVKAEDGTTGDVNKTKPRKKRLSKKDKLALNIIEEPKLTAFQQKYINNAQLILEFAESTNARFRLPSDCIMEHVESDNTYVISWIVIHNIKDIAKFSRKKKLKTVEEALFWADCPSPLFSTMDICLGEIPTRFSPLMLNSTKPIAEVQERMIRILEIGTRLSGYNLWYQLDGYDDAERAEDLRIDLNDYEHTLKGKRQRKNI